MVKTISLHDLAIELYERDAIWQVFHAVFTKEELIELWELCKFTQENPFGQAYDDEVYESLHEHGYFKETA